MNKIVDATGKLCPMPIIMTKKALKEIEEGIVETLIDSEISKENLEKMAREMGLSFETTEENGIYHVKVNKVVKSQEETENKDEKTVIVIASDKMGEGSEELGKILMKGFIYTLTEMEKVPSTILFYNSGAKITVEGSESVEDLKTLKERGTEILTCGTCLNYYGIEDKLAIGEISNMYTIIERQTDATKVIRP
ncbi:sulfurtransferase-like selenium metabolism protein YedF [Ilyobacter polytropus]|uniref:Selenium metabolism protein YedF n=1 Tax=Ilyobacter polytropus (strain ATCC 51220 / DSM 2926 / LMG 16218 / CuHBu1) TaxID=572544 RepID=E3HD07_ILYPC|nr:sulfurtransferase-like selenium metabolism protein YedF [Ilyobacter polytropus]ADO84063.1 selenium metabolism protein YedF [Ilyobacter polytropus DSM 2926]